MRILGILKIVMVLAMDFGAVYYLAGVEAAALVTGLILLYAWLGEYTALWKDGSVGLKHLNEYEKARLRRVQKNLTQDVKQASGADISGLKLRVIPSDDLNACAYGFRNMAVTRAALNACDDATLCAVLGHEVSHTLHMDAVFHRVVFANVTIVILGLAAGSLVSVSFMWIIFLVLCALGICGGMFSMLVFHGMNKMLKGTYTAIQYVVLFLYQTVMGLVSRRSEFRADKYSCQLGYGPQLSYFLTRFVEGQEPRQKSLNDILYSSHPATYKRVLRIQQHQAASGQIARQTRRYGIQ